MTMSWIDIAIILAYLGSTILIGLLLKRKAGKNMKSYYMGGNKLPWYMLGLSNASGMFDISGTMWLVTLCFVYGLQSIWIPWLWPVFNQVFLMIFLSMWVRRSGVLTGAEWIRTRFGDDTGGKLSHMVVVLFAIISVLGFLAYGFVGIGKFVEIFVPYSVVAPYLPFTIPEQYVPHFYGIIFTSIATFYVMLGGMMSIVWADVVQFTIITIASLAIGFIAMTKVSPDMLAAATPEGWSSPLFSWHLDLDWQNIVTEVNDKIASDGYSLFGLFVMMLLFKGVLVSAAGPAPNYDMQKILATKSPKEASLMSGFVSVALMPIRYFMIAGFTVLAVVFYQDLNLVVGGKLDFESILPSAILEFAPTGILGLLLAGLLAAFMSTFASTVNAAPAYLVNDIYKRYINPEASDKKLIHASYLVSIGVVVISTFIGFAVQSINSVLQWLVSGLWGGYVVSNVLKWYWWRLNGFGYFWGMLAGIIGAMLFPIIFAGQFPEVASDILPLYLFPLLLVFAAIGCVAGSYLTEPEKPEIIENFYKTVRPWGFWGPVKQAVLAKDPDFKVNTNFKSDMVNVTVGIVLQTCLVAAPIFLVIKEWQSLTIAVCLLAGSAIFLKLNWYNKLEDE
ncbi:Na+:solute symporter [Catenovulum sp. 2E275]|uniref:sodium:solute symporter family protein n=1 Tax=Catenovulum sp. 2E275 TaxID=2980497 RepID=UPI0021D2E285|nr:sodium:solute symporter family protein [Catenovulum sp. 2E275]MCU4677238.1 Na+:solute symporter [Catenovulum sp. 2E275]